MAKKTCLLSAVVLCAGALPACTDPATRPELQGEAGPPDPGGPPGGGDDDEPPTGTGADASTTSGVTTGPGDGDDDTSSSTGAPDTTAATSGDATMCGDGDIGPGEMCDDGEANDDHAFCTDQCMVNVCGDGKKFEDVELCDQGIANSDLYGSLCDKNCLPGRFCGDNIVQAGDEECDDGPGNGRPGEDGGEPACTSMCRLAARRAFITSAAFTGALGGLAGADDKCREAALAAGLEDPQTFYALLSTGDVSANQRFAAMPGEPLPLVLLTGQKIADSYPDLMANGPGDAGISVTEHGDPLLMGYVASNTAPNGDSASDDHDCAGWTSADKDLYAAVGYDAVPVDDPSWPLWKSEGWWVQKSLLSCDTAVFHLYCLQL